MCYYRGVQWNLSIKDTLNQGQQSNVDTMYLLLTLGVHAPQGNSSYVCVCVCVCVRFDFSKQWWISQEDLRIASALQSLDLNCGIFVKQPLREDTEFEWQPYWCTGWPFCLLSQVPSIYPFTWRCSRPRCVFVTGFAIVFGLTLYSAHVYLHHWTLASTTCNRSPEGRYDPI